MPAGKALFFGEYSCFPLKAIQYYIIIVIAISRPSRYFARPASGGSLGLTSPRAAPIAENGRYLSTDMLCLCWVNLSFKNVSLWRPTWRSALTESTTTDRPLVCDQIECHMSRNRCVSFQCGSTMKRQSFGPLLHEQCRDYDLIYKKRGTAHINKTNIKWCETPLFVLFSSFFNVFRC